MTRGAQSVGTQEHVPRHTGGTGRRIIQETNCVVHPQNIYVKLDTAQLQALSDTKTFCASVKFMTCMDDHGNRLNSVTSHIFV